MQTIKSSKTWFIIYDGDCGICEKFKNFIQWFDWLKRFQFIPFQNKQAFIRFPLLKEKECEEEIKVIAPDETIFGGADGVVRILSRLPAFFVVGYALRLPGLIHVTRVFYKWFARNRGVYF